MTALSLSHATIDGRIDDVSVAVPRGKLVGLIGPNGSGKSTLLQVAAGVLPASGTVSWFGRTLSSIPFLERARLATWVPQEAHFEFGFTVRDVVAQGRFAHGDDDEGIDATLTECDLMGLAARPVNCLSGGERHRVLLARAVATGAALQLWDEPFAALDVRHALEGFRLARQLVAGGKTVVLSLHDLRLAQQLDVIVALGNGRVEAVGSPSEVLTASLLNRVFGVRATSSPGLNLELL